MKINIAKLGLKKKTAEVKTTVKVVNEATNLQILMLKMDKMQLDSDADPLTVMEQSQQAVTAMTSFLQAVLKLSEKDLDTVMNAVTMEELSNFISYVLARIQGLTEEQWKQILKENAEEEDPKK
ncbi:molecular chaperone (plasmid) [Levilactobacillus suantsaii]|uniref:phage tail tube assembly chaperone n=1 Tax=Levilactobacillus suantsaii TaxID=2292255 RepID=UPI0015F565B2|nr:phage tail tube assembly chaperone [Levilactobacillus suantsaii]QMU09315.1 molecular chaperone [Levilactobacillus suantsaii]